MFVISLFSARVASGVPFRILPDSVLGGLAPKIAETCLEIPLGALESLSKDLFGPKGAPRDFQEASRLPKQLQELSKRSHDRF